MVDGKLAFSKYVAIFNANAQKRYASVIVRDFMVTLLKQWLSNRVCLHSKSNLICCLSLQITIVFFMHSPADNNPSLNFKME